MSHCESCDRSTMVRDDNGNYESCPGCGHEARIAALEAEMNTIIRQKWDMEQERDGIKARSLAVIRARDADLISLRDAYSVLESELREIRESYANIVAGRCAPDEVHCTCVPALRARVNELEAELAADRESYRKWGVLPCPSCAAANERAAAPGGEDSP